FSAVGPYLYALDPSTGTPVRGFGSDGRIDLREGLGRPPETQDVRLTSPGVVYRDLLIIGGRVSEGLPASPGDVRAFDVRTGELRWRVRTVPHPGQDRPGTWQPDACAVSGRAHDVHGMARDDATGI